MLRNAALWSGARGLRFHLASRAQSFPALFPLSRHSFLSPALPDRYQNLLIRRNFCGKSISDEDRSTSARKVVMNLQTIPIFEPQCPTEFVDFANTLADRAGQIVSQYFRKHVNIEIKSDLSPVTIADRAAELEMRALIAAKYPEHGVLGEEAGFEAGKGSQDDYIWVLDPVDGTASFITGKPLFGTLIALLHRGTPVLGIIDQPILKERWLGVSGKPTTFNGKPVSSRTCTNIVNSYLYSTSPHLFSGPSEEAFLRLRGSVRKTNYGCDCYAFGLLSLGHVDLVVEAGMQPWDYLAIVPVVEGAGGVMTDWQGQKLRLPSATDRSGWIGEVIAAGDKVTHEAALAALNWTPSSL